MKDFFTMFWSETPHVWSSKRVVTFIVALLWTFAIVSIWCYQSLKTGIIQEIPDSITNIYWGIMGGIFLFQVGGTAVDKLGNKQEEKK